MSEVEMGCRKLTYNEFLPTLKVVHSDLRISSNSCADDYRYGYQGSEKDDEIKGGGNSYTTHFRQLDPRIGRWLSVDPKASSMPWQSPYCSMDNNPIMFSDVMGDSIDDRMSTVAGKQTLYEFAHTANGYKQLSLYAQKGQVVGGRTFTQNGKYHNKGIDLVLTDNKTLGWMNGDTGDQGRTDLGYQKSGSSGMRKFGGVQGNGRMRIGININANLDEIAGGPELKKSNSAQGYKNDPKGHELIWNRMIAFKVQTLSHELFIHSEIGAQDFIDDGLINGTAYLFGDGNDHRSFGQAKKNRDAGFNNYGGRYEPYLKRRNAGSIYIYYGWKIAKQVHNKLDTKLNDYEIFKKHLGGLHVNE